MQTSKKQNSDKTEMLARDIDLIDDSGYEGFCLGIDVLLHVMGEDAISGDVIDVLEQIRDGNLHMPRRDLLSEFNQKGYDLFARKLARRALDVLDKNIDLSDDPEGDGGVSWT